MFFGTSGLKEYTEEVSSDAGSDVASEGLSELASDGTTDGFSDLSSYGSCSGFGYALGSFLSLVTH